MPTAPRLHLDSPKKRRQTAEQQKTSLQADRLAQPLRRGRKKRRQTAEQQKIHPEQTQRSHSNLEAFAQKSTATWKRFAQK
jgi:hypothetical protein